MQAGASAWTREKKIDLHGVLLVEFSFRAEVGEELAAGDVRHEEVEVARVLREPLQAHLRTHNK